MSGFNHYARLRDLIAHEPNGWYIARIDQPTTATNFRGEKVDYDHYYRLYTADGTQIKYGKFQKLEKLAKTLGVDELELPVVN